MPLHDSSQLCMCMCVCLYACVCIYVCAGLGGVHVCIYMHDCVCVHVHACRQAYVCACGGQDNSLGQNSSPKMGVSFAGPRCWPLDPLAAALFPTSSETVVFMRLWTPLQRTPHRGQHEGG